MTSCEDFLRGDSEDRSIETGDEVQDNEICLTDEVYDDCISVMSKDCVFTMVYSTGFGKKCREHLILLVDTDPGVP